MTGFSHCIVTEVATTAVAACPGASSSSHVFTNEILQEQRDKVDSIREELKEKPSMFQVA